MRSERPIVRPLHFTAVVVCLVAASALAQTDKTKAAREEIDRQLREMMGKPPTKVKITFVGLDEPGYKIEDVVLTLDGQQLATPSMALLSREGENLIFQGDYKPGDHRVEAKVTIVDASDSMVSYQAGYKWKVGVNRTFTLQPGLEVAVVISPTRDSNATDPKNKFKVSSTAVPKMLAVLDDGSIPPPPPKPMITPEAPDAGAAVSAEDEKKKKAEEAAAAKAAAAEEKKRKAEEAAAAKKAKAEEAAAAKAAAAEEKKQKAEEAKAAKLAAAEEKKRKGQEEAEAKRLAAEEKKAIEEGKLPRKEVGEAGAAPPPEPVVAAALPAEVDAGQPEPVDAGAPVAVLPPPEPAKKLAPPPPAEEAGIPWVAIGAGVGVLVALLILLARRRSNPKDPGL
jgi:hypothetical protein